MIVVQKSMFCACSWHLFISCCLFCQLFMLSDSFCLWTRAPLLKQFHHDIIDVLLYTNDLSHRPQKLHLKRRCHVNMLYLPLCEIHSDMKPQLSHSTWSGVYVTMEMFLVREALSVFLSLAGVNGASFCLVQHPCYFDVLAIPLPDQ